MKLDLSSLISLADSIQSLGVLGILILVGILLVTGRLHTDSEKKDWVEDREYREKLRDEATADRRQSDKVVQDLSATLKETNDLMRRSLDFSEKLVEEITSTASRQNRGS